MRLIQSVLLAAGGVLLASCGGGGEAGSDAKSDSSLIDSRKLDSAEKANTAEQAVEVYSVHLNRIADAIESIESDADAENAARTIALASQEFEILAEKFDDANKVRLASAFARSADDLTQPQMRIGLAMQKLAMQNPDYLQKISEAMDEMPDLN